MSLTSEKCEPCNAGGTPLSAEEAGALAKDVPAWTLSDNEIVREWKFEDFRAAMAFVSQVADAAEAEGHHPDIFIHYNRVKLALSTKKIGGLSRNDFILAAKIDALA